MSAIVSLLVSHLVQAGAAPAVTHNSASLLNDLFRREAVDRGLSAKLMVEEARAELARSRIVHEQNVRAGNAVARVERSLSQLRVIEATHRITEAESRIKEAEADEKMWDLRAKVDRGWTVSLVELAQVHAEYWRWRNHTSLQVRDRVQATHDFLQDELRTTRGLASRGAVSARDVVELNALWSQAAAQLEVAKEKVSVTEGFWKESNEALEWARTRR